MDKPVNPFVPRSMRWALMEEDWSDLTVRQIAEVFDTSIESVKASMSAIKRKTGYIVQYTGAPLGVPKGKPTGPRSESAKRNMREAARLREQRRREALGDNERG